MNCSWWTAGAACIYVNTMATSCPIGCLHIVFQSPFFPSCLSFNDMGTQMSKNLKLTCHRI